ncbi:GGDEF family protein [Photobacterium marinum]|uniref:diguanylate cyclase n=1 Tax=Photobacterium marinum TaxID=1056511 RepID=L8JER6_9GAMM|nr:GGDEF domain-containing protein [Photobacterium marinum]ELR67351.1 GGDEF family protein [Photobacterium marinum]
MSKDNFVESTETLKKTVPLMIKHKVPTTPTNYALWYTYATQQYPELNLAIDKHIDAVGHCTPTMCEQLYQEHLASQTDKDMTQLKQSLTAMMQELSHSMTDTLSETETFQGALDNTFAKLESAEKEGLSITDTMVLVRELIKESSQIRLSTGSLKNQLTNAQDEIMALREALSESQKAANEDAVTKLLNRRAFERDILGYQRNNIPYSLIILDIDKFKNFNDTYGHLLGDQVLKIVANRLNAFCQDNAQAYRFGGEEFIIILPGKMLASARHQAETLRRSIEKISVLDKKSGQRINSVTASFGVAERQVKESYEEVIERADSYLNKAKQLGRNRVLPLN